MEQVSGGRTTFDVTDKLNTPAAGLLTISLGYAMAQVVSGRPLTAAAWVHTQVDQMGFVVDKVALGQVLLRVLQF
jgi:hypothetical protein